MKDIPRELKAYWKSEIFNEETIPEGLKKDHQTAENVWAEIHILKGSLTYVIQEPEHEEIELSLTKVGIIEPHVRHHVIPKSGVRFYVEFYK